MKLCQGERIRRVTLAARLAGHWDNFPVGKWWNSYWEGNRKLRWLLLVQCWVTGEVSIYLQEHLQATVISQTPRVLDAVQKV